MQAVCVKLDAKGKEMLKQDMQDFNYSTVAEYIREALREKHNRLNEERAKKKAWKALFAARGALKGKSKFKTFEEWHDWRSNVYSKQLEKEMAEKYGGEIKAILQAKKHQQAQSV